MVNLSRGILAPRLPIVNFFRVRHQPHLCSREALAKRSREASAERSREAPAERSREALAERSREAPAERSCEAPAEQESPLTPSFYSIERTN